MGELGRVIGTTLDTTQAVPVDFQDVEVGDQIMVLTFYPSLAVALGTPGEVTGVTDSAGHTYFNIGAGNWEDSPEVVNTGVRFRLWLSDVVASPLTAGADSITVTWDNAVYDRNVFAWLVRYPGGMISTPGLGQTGDNDLAVKAQGFVTQGANAFFHAKNKGFEWGFALIAYPGGAIGFSDHPPFTDYYLYDFRLIVGGKQSYFLEQFSYQADVYTLAGSNHPTAFFDLIGLDQGNHTIAANNSIGQNYSVGVGNWKGAATFGFGD